MKLFLILRVLMGLPADSIIPEEPVLPPEEPSLTYDPSFIPVADAGVDKAVEEGDTVTLDGSDSSDLDENIYSYVWLQRGDKPVVTVVGSDNPTPYFIAPSDRVANTRLNFEVIVTDEEGATDTDTANVLIKNSITPLEPKGYQSISLNQVPSIISANQTYDFTGSLVPGNINDSEGHYAEIKDNNGNTLTFDNVDRKGKFAARWLLFLMRNHTQCMPLMRMEAGKY